MLRKQTFWGGVHPAGRKELSSGAPLEDCPPPREVVIPLLQHIGKPCTPLVKAGDHVDMGQKIARVARLYGKTDKEAERFIKEKDRKRKKYHDSHCNSKWSDSHTYDLSLNSSTLGVEGSVEFLSSYIDKRISKMK